MLDTYVKNQGETKFIIHDNNQNIVKNYKWDLDYDGNKANIDVDTTNQNGKKEHFNVQLNNDDLANILKIKSNNTPVDQQLLNDFGNNNFEPNLDYRQPDNYIIKINSFPSQRIPSQQPLFMPSPSLPPSLPLSPPHLLKTELFPSQLDTLQLDTLQLEPLPQLNERPTIMLMPNVDTNEIIVPKRKTRKRRKKSKKNKVQFLTHVSSPNSMENIMLPDVMNTMKPPNYLKTRKKRKIRRVFRIPKTKYQF
jgi:hypothetical protein